MHSWYCSRRQLKPKIKDYRSIALIHSIGKLIAKVLVNKLVSRLQELIHVNQNAFIKG
jgi:hypothetical protein